MPSQLLLTFAILLLAIALPLTYLYADRAGDYAVELTVHDGRVGSVPDRVVVRVGSAGAEGMCTYLPLLLRREP